MQKAFFRLRKGLPERRKQLFRGQALQEQTTMEELAAAAGEGS